MGKKRHYFNKYIDNDYRAVSHLWKKTTVIMTGNLAAGINLVVMVALHLVPTGINFATLMLGVCIIFSAAIRPFDKLRGNRDTGAAVGAWILCLFSCGWGIAFSHSPWWILVLFLEGLLCFALLLCMRWHYRRKSNNMSKRNKD